MESCYFSEEVVMIEILSRLPVKTLTRFKCVCKSWYDFIRSPFFIQKHLLLFGKSTTNGKYKDNGLFVFVSDYCNTKKVEAYIIQVSSVDDNVCANQDIRPFFPRACSLPLLVGSCNGIVCLTEYAYLDFYKGGKAILWNPATRELKTLPTSDHITGLYTEWGGRRGSLGFGFDAKSSDYKVVRIASCRAKDLIASIISPLAAVYSLATNSWKAIDCQVTCMFFEKICTINLNGICYWVARDAKWRLMILSFDMADEVFQKIPPPDLDCYGNEDDYKYKIYCNLMELRGLLALVINVRYKLPNFFDIWLIDKNGKNCTSSWVRHLRIELQVFIKEPLGFWLDGEEFLFNGGGSGVLSYNIKSQVIRDFDTNYGIPTSYIFEKRCVLYTESLVSLNTGTT